MQLYPAPDDALAPPPDRAAQTKRPRGRPPKTVDERDDGNRRQELIRAAARLFHRKGFHATSTRDIATAVGMRSGSPFYHFRSKGELLYAVMEEGMRSAIDRQRRALLAMAVLAAYPGECLIVAGGTGGHVYPGLAVAEALRARDVQLHWMGTERGIEARVVPLAGVPLTTKLLARPW